MIFSIVFYIFGTILQGLAKLFALWPWQSWPDAVLDGFEYFGSAFMTLNFMLPCYEALLAVDFAIVFFSGYYFVVGIVGLVDWLRGSGKIRI
jgi:hypothetical protein